MNRNGILSNDKCIGNTIHPAVLNDKYTQQ